MKVRGHDEAAGCGAGSRLLLQAVPAAQGGEQHEVCQKNDAGNSNEPPRKLPFQVIGPSYPSHLRESTARRSKIVVAIAVKV
jgi:hypothetical protein